MIIVAAAKVSLDLLKHFPGPIVSVVLSRNYHQKVSRFGMEQLVLKCLSRCCLWEFQSISLFIVIHSPSPDRLLNKNEIVTVKKEQNKSF